MGPTEMHVIEWLKAAGPTLVGLGVVLIAWRQWKTAHQKVKLDLFQRRLEMYTITVHFVREMQLLKTNEIAVPHRYERDTFAVPFIFGKRVNQLRDELIQKGVQWMYGKENKRLHDPFIKGNETKLIVIDNDIKAATKAFVDAELILESAFMNDMDFRDLR